MKNVYAFFLLFLLSGMGVFAQVSINSDNSMPDNSAMLDVKSTSKGLLIPRMTQTDIQSISNPANGLQVFCTTDGKIYIYVTLANNWKEVSYGAGTLMPPCGTPIFDIRDGKIYNTIQLGTQCWFKENLNIGTRTNGSGEQTNNSTIDKYCYNDLESNCNTYGGLYQWNEAMQYSTTQGVQGICPAGWHLPTDAEWTTLTTYVNSQPSYQCNSTSGWIAKAMAATTLWNSSTNTCAIGNNLSLNNATGFTALPGGYRDYDGTFVDIGYYGYWWSSSEFGTNNAWGRSMNYLYGDVTSYGYSKYYGFSVRCLRD